MAFTNHPINIGNNKIINLIGDNVSGTAPLTVTNLSLPLSEDIYGGTNHFLGDPAGWLNISISGFAGYKIPYYK